MVVNRRFAAGSDHVNEVIMYVVIYLYGYRDNYFRFWQPHCHFQLIIGHCSNHLGHFPGVHCGQNPQIIFEISILSVIFLKVVQFPVWLSICRH